MWLTLGIKAWLTVKKSINRRKSVWLSLIDVEVAFRYYLTPSPDETLIKTGILKVSSTYKNPKGVCIEDVSVLGQKTKTARSGSRSWGAHTFSQLYSMKHSLGLQ